MHLILSWHWKYYDILWLSTAYINWLSKGCGLQLCDNVHHMFANSHNALNLCVLSSCVTFLTASLRFSWSMFVLNFCGFVYVIRGERNGSYTVKDIWGNKIAHVNTLEVFYLEFLSIVTTEQIYEPQWILVRVLCHLTSLQVCVFSTYDYEQYQHGGCGNSERDWHHSHVI